jgi:DNA mismatch endonuclease, patch repair protein
MTIHHSVRHNDQVKSADSLDFYSACFQIDVQAVWSAVFGTPQKADQGCRLVLITVDTLTPTERSERMSRVRSKDTKPEMLVRGLVHRMGFRYRLHRRDLPGNPDLVFPKRGKIIFVHGCFWHRHGTCKHTRWPKSRLEFWKPKLEQNRRRDLANQRALRALGWEILIVWECQLGNVELLRGKLRAFLEGGA